MKLNKLGKQQNTRNVGNERSFFVCVNQTTQDSVQNFEEFPLDLRQANKHTKTTFKMKGGGRMGKE